LGRPKLYEEQMPARLPQGTMARMDAVLQENETRADLLRRAIDREIKHRRVNGKKGRG